jgi:hypothetical protein
MYRRCYIFGISIPLIADVSLRAVTFVPADEDMCLVMPSVCG